MPYAVSPVASPSKSRNLAGESDVAERPDRRQTGRSERRQRDARSTAAPRARRASQQRRERCRRRRPARTSSGLPVREVTAVVVALRRPLGRRRRRALGQLRQLAVLAHDLRPVVPGGCRATALPTEPAPPRSERTNPSANSAGGDPQPRHVGADPRRERTSTTATPGIDQPRAPTPAAHATNARSPRARTWRRRAGGAPVRSPRAGGATARRARAARARSRERTGGRRLLRREQQPAGALEQRRREAGIGGRLVAELERVGEAVQVVGDGDAARRTRAGERAQDRPTPPPRGSRKPSSNGTNAADCGRARTASRERQRRLGARGRQARDRPSRRGRARRAAR